MYTTFFKGLLFLSRTTTRLSYLRISTLPPYELKVEGERYTKARLYLLDAREATYGQPSQLEGKRTTYLLCAFKAAALAALWLPIKLP